MATPEQVADVRRMAAEATTDTYTDDTILGLLDRHGSAEAAAAAIWQEKAGKYAVMTDTSESGSSRKKSQLHGNALRMAAYYEGLSKAPTVDPVAEVSYPFTTDIERV